MGIGGLGLGEERKGKGDVGGKALGMGFVKRLDADWFNVGVLTWIFIDLLFDFLILYDIFESISMGLIYVA